MRTLSKSYRDTRKAYNQSVYDVLKAGHPHIALHLDRYGISLGWWNTIHYLQTTGTSPEVTAAAVVDMHAKQTFVYTPPGWDSID